MADTIPSISDQIVALKAQSVIARKAITDLSTAFTADRQAMILKYQQPLADAQANFDSIQKQISALQPPIQNGTTGK